MREEIATETVRLGSKAVQHWKREEVRRRRRRRRGIIGGKREYV